MTAQEIIAEEATKAGLTAADLIGTRRIKRIVRARHRAMWRCRHELGMILQDIADAFNRDDHTTVLHAIRKIDLGQPYIEAQREKSYRSMGRLT